jgi:hypothetical protein
VTVPQPRQQSASADTWWWHTHWCHSFADGAHAALCSLCIWCHQLCGMLTVPLPLPCSTIKQRVRANHNWAQTLSSKSFVTQIRALNRLDQLLFDHALMLMHLDKSFYTDTDYLMSRLVPEQLHKYFRQASTLKQWLLSFTAQQGAIAAGARSASRCGVIAGQ